ncbi:hypothetical protein TcWFU_009952 [Taenia crassiceps]|uniref:Uncharacterized protein n=1 Tax=Taenia crassiceps TaxID=6207 RepID=A0ABR4QMV7_9CEST
MGTRYCYYGCHWLVVSTINQQRLRNASYHRLTCEEIHKCSQKTDEPSIRCRARKILVCFFECPTLKQFCALSLNLNVASVLLGQLGIRAASYKE